MHLYCGARCKKGVRLGDVDDGNDDDDGARRVCRRHEWMTVGVELGRISSGFDVVRLFSFIFF